ncbi:MAG: hypothetical protein ABSA44_00865 [Bacteroidota bacterium]|jgi:hypothetical protein
MELESEISILRSKHQVDKLIRWIGTDSKRFAQLMRLFLLNDQNISRRSAWVVGHCCERHPDMAKPWLKVMIKKMQEPGIHSAIQRNVLRVLQYVEIPASLKGTVANICFNFISDTKAAVAPQAFAMTVLANIAVKKPDLLKELRVFVYQMLPFGTPAFRAWAKKIFKDLDLRQESYLLNKNEEDKLLYDWLMKKE